MVDPSGFVLKRFPVIKTSLKTAHLSSSPEAFVKRALKMGFFLSMGLGMITFLLMVGSAGIMVVPLMIAAFIVGLPVFTFFIIFTTPKTAIRKRQKEIDNDILFAGRYLLVKLESGYPLINTLEGASKSSGTTSKYFKEIMNDLDLGIPLEEALDTAILYNSSEKFKKILWTLRTTLKTGSEVGPVLRQILKTIATEQSIEIKKYGKKLNSIAMFYMILACAGPALGLTIAVILTSFLGLDRIPTIALGGILCGVGAIQTIFLLMVNSSRPMVNV